ncbi:MAG: hypothetical protein BLITH_1030 [Brockia lithotrophica]|uniref:Uncharacterized protein n=1 Tax=Brockia lithotrophica TaxID=933949 RepID=A0A2T5G795_9BACL|nr:MAG: hypothetical protein BLITH_1030 [Brockia lithotrophica]
MRTERARLSVYSCGQRASLRKHAGAAQAPACFLESEEPSVTPPIWGSRLPAGDLPVPRATNPRCGSGNAESIAEGLRLLCCRECVDKVREASET